MQLTSITVDWNKVENLPISDNIDAAVWNAGEDLRVGEPPWPSDSTMQVVELSECYEAIKETLTGPTRENADKIMNSLVHSSFEFPWELKRHDRGEHIIGAMSPQTVSQYLNVFPQLSYSELDEAFDSRMPPETRKSYQIAEYPSEDVFTGYLRQWEGLLSYAADRNAGILLHMG